MEFRAHHGFRRRHMLVTHAGKASFASLLGSGLSFRALSGRAPDVPRIRLLLVHFSRSKSLTLDLKYVAGLFDGEGYIRINRWQTPNSIHIRYNLFGGINMTYKPVIQQLHQQFEGHFAQNRRSCYKPTHRTLYTWMISSRRCAEFIRQIRPYLIVKADEVDLALEFQDSINRWRHKLGHRGSIPPERAAVFADRDRLYREISELKHRRFDLA